MKIDTLLNREPFGEILEKTLSRFFSIIAEKEVNVRWIETDKEKRQLFQEGYTIWNCNSKINSIFPDNVKKEVIQVIRKEYGRAENEKIFKRIARKGYLQFATGIASEALATHFIGVSTHIYNQEGMLIIGGNNKIRIIDHNANLVYVILKDQFSKKYLDRETEIRIHHEDLPIPKLVGDFRKHGYIVEEFISGVSINRLNSRELSASILNQAYLRMLELYEKSLQPCTVTNYINKIKERVAKLLDNIRFLNQQEKEAINQFVDFLTNLIQSNYKNTVLYLVQTHGDFQFGNILVKENNDFAIIDWETSEMRSLFYDSLVLQLNSRQPKNLSERIRYVLSKGYSDEFSTFIFSTFSGILSKDASNLYFYCFLLEDILFYLEENDNLQTTKIGDSLYDLIREIPLIEETVTNIIDV